MLIIQLTGYLLTFTYDKRHPASWEWWPWNGSIPNSQWGLHGLHGYIGAVESIGEVLSYQVGDVSSKDFSHMARRAVDKGLSVPTQDVEAFCQQHSRLMLKYRFFFAEHENKEGPDVFGYRKVFSLLEKMRATAK